MSIVDHRSTNHIRLVHTAKANNHSSIMFWTQQGEVAPNAYHRMEQHKVTFMGRTGQAMASEHLDFPLDDEEAGSKNFIIIPYLGQSKKAY